MANSHDCVACTLNHHCCSLQAIVYFSVRTAKEGLTVDILAQELQVDIDTPYESMGGATELVEDKPSDTAAVNNEVTETPVDSDKETPLV